jgi:hypothetical protein
MVETVCVRCRVSGRQRPRLCSARRARPAVAAVLRWESCTGGATVGRVRPRGVGSSRVQDRSGPLIRRAIVVLERSAGLGALASGHRQPAAQAVDRQHEAWPGGAEDGLVSRTPTTPGITIAELGGRALERAAARLGAGALARTAPITGIRWRAHGIHRGHERSARSDARRLSCDVDPAEPLPAMSIELRSRADAHVAERL